MYDDEYYQSLDLNSFLGLFNNTSPERARKKKFTDAISAFFRKSEFEEIKADKLLQILGIPDKVTVKDNFEIWEYGYYQQHGPDFRFGEMPFKIKNGVVIYCQTSDEIFNNSL